MPITAFGSLAKNFSTWPRLRLRRSTTSPAALRPCTSNTFFAMSSPIMIAFSMDGPLSLVAVCPEPVWHTDAGWGPSTPSSRAKEGLFRDGEPFNAEAAKYSLERHMNIKGSFRKPELAAVDSVEAAGPLAVRLNLKQPFSPLLSQLTDRAGMMVSPKAAETAGDKFALKPVCAGPYKFVERVAQDRIVVEKFADYWNKDHVFIDKITYLPIVDSTVRLANLKSGGLDMMERVLATDIKAVRDNPKLRLSKAVSLAFFALLVNVANGSKADNPLGKDA